MSLGMVEYRTYAPEAETVSRSSVSVLNITDYMMLS
jgi:hypothetical protein